MAKPVSNRSPIAAFFNSFCDVSIESANRARAERVVSTAAAPFALALVVLTLIVSNPFATWTLGFGVLLSTLVLRFVLARGYRAGSSSQEKRWAALYSLSNIGVAVGWSWVLEGVLLSQAGLGYAAILVIVLTAGVSTAGASSLSVDRWLAQIFISILLLPLVAVMSLKFGGEFHTVAVAVAISYVFLSQQIKTQAAIYREMMDRWIKYDALSEATQECIVIHQDGTILEVNAAFEREFGYAQQEIVGRHTLPLVDADDRARGLEILRRGDTSPTRMTFVRKDGSTFQGETFSRFFNYHGVRCKIVCVLNVSERLRAKEAAAESARQMQAVEIERSREALESARLKSEFVANMSHEIRTPLNAIIGITELLGDTYPTDIQKRYLRTLSDSSELLLTLINDVLDFSKIDAGKLELESLEFSIISVIESQADLLSPRARSKSVNIVTSIDSDMPTQMRGDAGRIAQVLLNLIGNAIKFTERGHIDVRASMEETDGRHSIVRFEVVDTGEGMAPEAIARLFQPFTQADSSTSRKHGGTGLGLSICKRLVEAMGGRIGVESSVGAGSKFWFTLPLEVVDPESIRAKFSRGDWSSRQIFVVTDENSSARSVARSLQAWGLTATIGTSGWLRRQPGQAPIYDAVIASSSFRRRTKLDFEGPIIEIQNEGGAYVDSVGAFASIPNPVRQSDLYDVVVNALTLSPDRTTALSLAPRTSEAVAPAAAGPTDDSLLRAGARVLVAEDNSTNQMLALAQLRKLGISAQPVSNGVEALEALNRGVYDLVLMDCQMPEMDGFEATRKIRELEAKTGRRIPIVALTANAFEQDRQRCLQVGMDAYLAKPLRREQLVAVLKQFLVRAA